VPSWLVGPELWLEIDRATVRFRLYEVHVQLIIVNFIEEHVSFVYTTVRYLSAAILSSENPAIR
jgi:hypothetical protein